jgi:hypothetical protein
MKIIPLIGYLLAIAITTNAHQSDFSKIMGNYFGQKPPESIPELFASEIICKESRWEFAPTFSPNGKYFFCTIWEKQDRSDERIWYSKIDDEKWTDLAEAPFSSDYFEYLPCFTSDSCLFFLSKRPFENQEKSLKYARLWSVKISDSIFRNPKPICLGDSIYPRYFSVSGNKTIYLNIEGKNGIFKSVFKDYKYQKPEKITGDINSLEGISRPYISADESYMLIDAPGSSGIEGDYDLYISYRNEKNEWCYPIHLGNSINSHYFEGAATVSPDSKYIFFTRFINGISDIYWVSSKIIEKLKPKE